MAEIGSVKMRVPALIKPGDVVTVKMLILHPMELPKRDKDGNEISGEYNYLKNVVVTYAGKEVARFDISPGISANPFFAFRVKATEPGPVTAVFTDTKGRTYQGSVEIKFG